MSMSKRTGTYICAGCGQTLFESDAKFDSGCGWPSFTAPAADSHVDEERDVSHGMVRTEVLCSKCNGHLGHVFDGRPRPDRPALLHQFGGAETAAEISLPGRRLGPALEPTARICFSRRAACGARCVRRRPVEEARMSLGMILIIIVIIYLLGGFSGRFGGYGYGMGHSGMGLGGVILVVLIILLLLGKL